MWSRCLAIPQQPDQCNLSLRELPIKLVYLHHYKVVLLLVTWCQNARSAHRNVWRSMSWTNNTVKAPWRIGFRLDWSLAYMEEMEQRNPTLHGPTDGRMGRESKGKNGPLCYWEQGSRNIWNPALWEGQRWTNIARCYERFWGTLESEKEWNRREI